ncbi:MAG: DeoR/GlpR family DNA-binding transcription regulator [Saccharofermentans sp.]|nr:DeoR/GlpR family DNA-binding transcription regulator [Saccharofermentans sp.]
MINLERRKNILDILETEGSINTNDLSVRLGVTGATIRTDLRDLAREGAIVRYHGGVRLPDKHRDEVSENYMVRSVTNIDLKKMIGKQAALLVGNGDTIFMDASSTAFHMIPYLEHTMDVTVITNGINTAIELQRYNNFKSIILIGGMLRPHSGTIEGVMSREMINRLSAEYYFVSGNGFSADAGLSGNNFFELELKRICVERSKNIVALVDSTKIGDDSASVFITPNKIDYLITDNQISDETASSIRAKKINLVIAGEDRK